MIIKKFIGKTEEEAKNKAREELCKDAVIMNVRLVKPKGIKGVFGRISYEITAAIEDKDLEPKDTKGFTTKNPSHGKINLEANENIKIPPLPNRKPAANAAPLTPDAKAIAESISEITPILRQHGVLDDARPNSLDIVPELPPEDSAISKFQRPKKESESSAKVKAVEKKIESLQESLKNEPKEPIDFKEAANKKTKNSNLRIIKMIYNILIENEVSEKYANQILDEVEPVVSSNNNMDIILSNVYQKMILKFGKHEAIKAAPKKPEVIFFIGPTGVGKTTTIAKLASMLKLNMDKSIAFLTADTYRIAATDQLQTYANILGCPLKVIYSPDEIKNAVRDLRDNDFILVDTAGFSHKHEEQKAATKQLIESLPEKYSKEVYLLLSATTKNKDLIDIADAYNKISDYKIIFTKLDETLRYGNLLNLRLHTGAAIAYTTNGQNVPDDIQEFDSQYIVKQLLGGK